MNNSTLQGQIHAPASPVSRIREATANFWRDFMYWSVEHCPLFVLITRPFFLWFALKFSKTLRDGPTANARRLLSPGASDVEVERLRRKMIQSAYTSIYELGLAAGATETVLSNWIEKVDGLEYYQQARESGNGAIIVTAHIGPFEVSLSALRSREKKIHVIYQRDARSGFDHLRSKLRAKLGIIEEAIDDGWAIWTHMRDALLADNIIVIQGDRVMPGQRGVPVPFLGGHVLFPTGPIKLAMISGSPIIPIFSVRTRVGHCRVIINKPVFVSREPGPVNGDHPALRNITSAIARVVQAHPEQWAMYEKVWLEDMNSDPAPFKT